MKAGASSLNPYAASYVPLSKRGGAGETNDTKIPAHQSKSGNEANWSGHQPNHIWTQGDHHNVSLSYVQGSDPAKPEYGFYASSSQYPHEMSGKLNFSEDFDMDLAYLQMTFPAISEESLSDVYSASGYDLHAAVDMLNQLELCPADSSEKLPDTLDIGDVPEAQSPREASQKLKNVTGKIGAIPGSSESA